MDVDHSQISMAQIVRHLRQHERHARGEIEESDE
jgi:hypothetical protein